MNLSRRWTAVILLSALFFVSYVDRLALVVLIEPLKQDLHIDDVQVGFLVGTAAAVIGMGFLAPLSRAADISNRRNLIAAGAVIWNLTTIASGFTTNYWELLICRMGVALGEAALMPAAMSLIADLFTREQRGAPVGIFILGGGVGASGAVLVTGATLGMMSSTAAHGLPVIGDFPPWRMTLIALGAAGLVVGALFFLLVREPRRVDLGEGKVPLRDLGRHMRENTATYLPFLSAGGINALTNLGVIAWYVSNLVRTYGLTPAQAGLLFGIVSVVGTAIGCVGMPTLATRLNLRGRHNGPVWVILVAVCLFGPLMVLSLNAPTATLSLAFMAPAFLLQIGAGAVITGSIPTLPPPRMRGQMMAVYLWVAGGAALGIGPVLVAFLSERLFPGPEGVGKALMALIILLTPIEALALILSLRPFERTAARAAAIEDAASQAANRA